VLEVILPLIAYQFSSFDFVAELDPSAHYEIVRQCHWTTRGHRWDFLAWSLKGGEDQRYPQHFSFIYLDRKVVLRFLETLEDPPPWKPWGTYLAAQVVRIPSPYESVVAVRGASGFGFHWDTVFYGFSGREATFIGRTPGRNSNGPVPVTGRRFQWLFDNFDIYELKSVRQGVTKHIVFLVEKGKTMKKVREWTSHKKVRRVVWLKDL
jgi:hypothetical protein